MKEQRGYIVILPEQIIEIPLSSNLSWLRMFYALPRELVEKRPEYLELPRKASWNWNRGVSEPPMDARRQ